MSTYLITHKPKQYQWNDIEEALEKLNTVGYERRWSSGTYTDKSINIGDRVFMIRLETAPKGIFASGTIRKAYKDLHWEPEKRDQGKQCNYVYVRFDALLNPDKESVLPLTLLQERWPLQKWTPRGFGRIEDKVADVLELEWRKFRSDSTAQDEVLLPEEEMPSETYPEGAVRTITINSYERNPNARKRCLNVYGHNCRVCGFNFEKAYGPIGADFIHVHHLKPLSEVGSDYKVNPETDLAPVCPNCHAMLHRRTPPYSIEELRTMLK